MGLHFFAGDLLDPILPGIDLQVGGHLLNGLVVEVNGHGQAEDVAVLVLQNAAQAGLCVDLSHAGPTLLPVGGQLVQQLLLHIVGVVGVVEEPVGHVGQVHTVDVQVDIGGPVAPGQGTDVEVHVELLGKGLVDGVLGVVGAFVLLNDFRPGNRHVVGCGVCGDGGCSYGKQHYQHQQHAKDSFHRCVPPLFSGIFPMP